MPGTFHPISGAEMTRRAWRLPGLPRGKLIFAARWVVTVLAVLVLLNAIDLGAIKGTGPAGKITKQDVEAAMAAPAAQERESGRGGERETRLVESPNDPTTEFEFDSRPH